MMCVILGMIIVDFCDVLDLEQVVLQIVVYQGLVYMCLVCGNVLLVLDEYDYQFELGRVKEICDGNDVFIIFSGFMIMCVLEVVKVLEVDNVSVGVLYCLIIKFFDEVMVVEQVRKKNCLVVVVENYLVIGGLGEIVVSMLMCYCVQLVGFQMVGLLDVFFDVGVLLILYDWYGISCEVLSQWIREWLK